MLMRVVLGAGASSLFVVVLYVSFRLVSIAVSRRSGEKHPRPMFLDRYLKEKFMSKYRAE